MHRSQLLGRCGVEIMTDITEILQADFALGEGPVWDARRKVVWFVDIKRHRLWHLDPANGSNAISEAPDQIGWVLPASNGQLLCGLKDGLYTFAPGTARFKKLMDVPGELPTNRLNDACTDRWGRVWFGSMDDGESDKNGRFYVFDRGTITPAGPSGIAITNGPAVNADSSRIYFTDSVNQNIMVADLDREKVSEASLFADITEHFPDAFPDGPTVDSEGCVWTGLYNGSAAVRFSPAGELIETIKLPAKNITKLCLGGPDLRTAFVTTARQGMSDEALTASPLSGSLLTFRVNVPGFEPIEAAL